MQSIIDPSIPSVGNIIHIPDPIVFLRDSNWITYELNKEAADYVNLFAMSLTVTIKISNGADQKSYTLSNYVHDTQCSVNLQDVLADIYALNHNGFDAVEPQYYITDIVITVYGYNRTDTTSVESITIVSSENYQNLLSTCRDIRNGVTLPNRGHFTERDVIMPNEAPFYMAHETTDVRVPIELPVDGWINNTFIPAYTESHINKEDSCSSDISITLNSHLGWNKAGYSTSYGVSQIIFSACRATDDGWEEGKAKNSLTSFLKTGEDTSLINNYKHTITPEFGPNNCPIICLFEKSNSSTHPYRLKLIAGLDTGEFSLLEKTTILLESVTAVTDVDLINVDFNVNVLRMKIHNAALTGTPCIGTLYAYVSMLPLSGTQRYAHENVTFILNEPNLNPFNLSQYLQTPYGSEIPYDYCLMDEDSKAIYTLKSGMFGSLPHDAQVASIKAAFNNDDNIYDFLFWNANTFRKGGGMNDNPLGMAGHDEEGNPLILRGDTVRRDDYRIINRLYNCLNFDFSSVAVEYTDGPATKRLTSQKTTSNALILESEMEDFSMMGMTILPLVVHFSNGTTKEFPQRKVRWSYGANQYYSNSIPLTTSGGIHYNIDGNTANQPDYIQLIVPSYCIGRLDGDILSMAPLIHNGLLINDQWEGLIIQHPDANAVNFARTNSDSLNTGVYAVNLLYNLTEASQEYYKFPFVCTDYVSVYYHETDITLFDLSKLSAHNGSVSADALYTTYFNLGNTINQNGTIMDMSVYTLRFFNRYLFNYIQIREEGEYSDIINVLDLFRSLPKNIKYSQIYIEQDKDIIVSPCTTIRGVSFGEQDGELREFVIHQYSICENKDILWIRYLNADGLERWAFGTIKERTYATHKQDIATLFPKVNSINKSPLYTTNGYEERLTVLFADIPQHMYIEDMLQSPILMAYNDRGTIGYNIAIEEEEIVRNGDPLQDFVLHVIKKY